MNSRFVIVLTVVGICSKQAVVGYFGGSIRSRFIVIVEEIVGTSFAGISSVAAIVVDDIIE